MKNKWMATTQARYSLAINSLRKKKEIPNMVHNNLEVLGHWNEEDVGSMYDKHSINALIRLLKSHSSIGVNFLDSFGGKF